MKKKYNFTNICIIFYFQKLITDMELQIRKKTANISCREKYKTTNI